MSRQAARSLTDMVSTRRLFLFVAILLGSQVVGPAFAQEEGG
jgi:hypothetical protein